MLRKPRLALAQSRKFRFELRICLLKIGVQEVEVQSTLVNLRIVHQLCNEIVHGGCEALDRLRGPEKIECKWF